MNMTSLLQILALILMTVAAVFSIIVVARAVRLLGQVQARRRGHPENPNPGKEVSK